MKSYVILQKGFEYDDSIYSESEGGGGHPKLVTFSKDEVDSKIKELNLIEYKITSIRDYTYEIEDILNVDIEEYLIKVWWKSMVPFLRNILGKILNICYTHQQLMKSVKNMFLWYQLTFIMQLKQTLIFNHLEMKESITF